MKEVEKEMNSHKDFIDSEVKNIQGLKSGFGGIRNNHKTLQQETETRKITFTNGKKGIEGLVGHITSWKSQLESEKENHGWELDDFTDRVETEWNNLEDLETKNSDTLKEQDEEYQSTASEKNATIKELMEKVKFLRAKLKDERSSYRELEDTLETVLEERLETDVNIQTTTKKIRDRKDPKYDPSALEQAKEKNELLRR